MKVSKCKLHVVYNSMSEYGGYLAALALLVSAQIDWGLNTSLFVSAFIWSLQVAAWVCARINLVWFLL